MNSKNLMGAQAPLPLHDRDPDYDKITVTPGRVRLSSIDVALSRPDVLVLEVDSASKYPEVTWGTSTDGAISVFPFETARTLRLDESTSGMTQIELPARTKGWDVIATAARYTIRIVAWRPWLLERTEVWSEHTAGVAGD